MSWIPFITHTSMCTDEIYIYKKSGTQDTDSKTKFSVSVFSRFSKYLDSPMLLECPDYC